MSLPFPIGIVDKYELPSLERAGAIAQEVGTEALVFIKFNQTRTIVETSTGLPVTGLAENIYNTVPNASIGKTVLVGSILESDPSVVWLVDVSKLEGKSVRGMAWAERLDLLKKITDGFTTEGVKTFKCASFYKRGLMKVLSDVQKKNKRLLVRVPSKTKAFLI